MGWPSHTCENRRNSIICSRVFVAQKNVAARCSRNCQAYDGMLWALLSGHNLWPVFTSFCFDMFISIVFKNTESDLDFKALYGIITLPKWWFSNRKDCCFEGPIFHNKGNVFERFNNVKDTNSLLKSLNPSSLIVIIAISSFGFHSCARATPDTGFRGLLESHLCNNSPWEMLVASWIFCVSVV